MQVQDVKKCLSHEFAKKAFLGHLIFLSLKDKVVSKVAEMVDFSKIRRN